MTKVFHLNRETGFADILDGDWSVSDRSIPLLMFAPIPNEDGSVPTTDYIPYAYRPLDQTLEWVGDPEGIVVLERGHLSLIIERRFLRSPDEQDTTASSKVQFAGVFEPNPQGSWAKVDASQGDYTEIQPIEGETVLLCGHLTGDNAANHDRQHFWKVKDVEFTRPDGTTECATWFVLCEMCHTHLHNNPGWNPPITSDARWKGNAPAIRQTRDDPTQRS